MIGLSAIARLASGRDAATDAARCELCGVPLGESHRHVVEIGVRGVQCSCPACAILFSRDDSAARFRTVPERFIAGPTFAITMERWTSLDIPVALAYFVRDSGRGQPVVCYPGPAGITDAELEPAQWDKLCTATSLAAMLAADVEALLVHGEPGAPTLACYLVPITTAYELAGRLRRTWRGFSGGHEAQCELAELFDMLDRRGGRP